VWSTEHPTPILGTFEPALAEAIPRPVVVVTLQHHQKSFAVERKDGSLLPAFIAVRDGGSDHLASVRTGHEWVVRARLADARFFLEEDRRMNLRTWNAALERVAYVAGLGTVADHVRRLATLGAWLAEAIGADPAERRVLARAAELSKADLVTAMVREFPELQGTMGGIYAREAGEPEAVAVAIEEHYLPKGAGDAPPSTRPGALVAIADRAVLLAGAMLMDFEPTGSQDPYGLRRAASGIVATLVAHGLHVSLRTMFETAASAYDRSEAVRAKAAAASVISLATVTGAATTPVAAEATMKPPSTLAHRRFAASGSRTPTSSAQPARTANSTAGR
jgi:glycyl-tRNA synthetase beta chain